MAKDILSNLTPPPGSRKNPKRIGRGQGSGHGGTATRGHKGAGSRSGTKYRPWFEGGQMPLARRVPKRGFHSPFKKVFQLVNLDTLQRIAAAGKFTDGQVTPEVLKKLGVIKKEAGLVKVLGNGDIKAKLSVSAHAFSKTAKEKIAGVGGTAQLISAMAKE
jgi:large subunit ribosomal protein L15